MDASNWFSDAKLDAQSSEPLYQQIADMIIKKIRHHVLAPGTKLPPERELAALFDVSRTTAINAYRALERQGWVRTRVGSGTYVERHATDNGGRREADEFKGAAPLMPWMELFAARPQSPLSTILRDLVAAPLAEDNIALAAGMADPNTFPIATMQRLFAEQAGETAPSDFGHIPTEGYGPLRHAIATGLAVKGIDVTGEQVMTFAGSQNGLYLLARVMLEPGDYVIVEAPTFIGAVQVFQGAGARLLSLPVSEGLDLALLEDYLIRYRPKFFYINPTFHNPTGRVLSERLRRDLLEVAARYRLVIVEDDAYSELFYHQPPPPPLKAADGYGGVVYLNTFSKLLFPGLRVGYLAASPTLINRLALEKQYIDLHTSNISQWLLHGYLKSGELPGHANRVRALYKKRRDALAQALRQYCGNDLSFSIPDGGFYLWCRIEGPLTARDLLHEAIKGGVSFVPGDAFYRTPEMGGQQFRLCFTTHPEPLLAEAARRIGDTLRRMTKTRRPAAGSVAVQPII
ncbi:aminotransferase class I/II-fold pyridoxal phosphate-dependent enzyme [Heliobacterium gestii]|uniref:Aminotransferase class I/II-fold pyridoxal phosphate-dependent enzyme n=1 Tax=Heliomicrobium gestii TaxID=2699 RepID=A0A845LHL1_HELGE|nr:PLP-dependent aminotransferase family protein [Heliomicrobium gestii]MBM7866933.1 DNA-binding transcriptional MocR family regulator [Heliomicrobium gestii]MZP42356.1 aminotransferase class I/II-fold pyridoxal phosphate-dependent enzyme [Heliomicrobium gestii]